MITICDGQYYHLYFSQNQTELQRCELIRWRWNIRVIKDDYHCRAQSPVQNHCRMPTSLSGSYFNVNLEKTFFSQVSCAGQI